MRTIRLFIGSVFLLLFSTLASTPTQANDIQGVHIVDYGIFSGKVTSANHANKTAGKKLIHAALLKRTEGIPAKVGTEFGIEYVVIGTDSSKQVKLDFRMTLPTVFNPKERTSYNEFTWSKEILTNQKNYSGYGFDHTWELVPGLWTIEIWHAGEKVAKKMFAVYEP